MCACVRSYVCLPVIVRICVCMFARLCLCACGFVCVPVVVCVRVRVFLFTTGGGCSGQHVVRSAAGSPHR